MSSEEAQKQKKEIDDDYRFYRQSGLGLSATVILLSGTLLNFILKHLSDIHTSSPPSLLFYVGSGTLVLAITAAIAIQWFHYEGYKRQARKHFPDPPTSTESQALQKQANRWWFPLGDHAVYLSVGFLIIGFILSVAYWRIDMANEYRFLQTFLIGLLLLGVWILALGLKIQRKEVKETEQSPPSTREKIRPSWWGWTGLGIVTLVGLLLIYMTTSQ